MKIKPFGERVLIKPIAEKTEEKTKSGILLEGTVMANEKPLIAEVLEVGTGEKIKDILVGHKVIYAKYSGVEIKDGEDKVILINADDVLGVVN